MISRPLNAALVAWWKSHRPHGWSMQRHLDNPTVGCTHWADIQLADAVATSIKNDLMEKSK